MCNDLQFGFKQNVSTTQSAFALSEVISYYNFNRSNVYTIEVTHTLYKTTLVVQLSEIH